MTIPRVKHPTIPVSAFKPDGSRRKVLRWFENEHLKHPHDCSLRVENERGENFELWADFVSTAVNVPTRTEATEIRGREPLAQSTVDKIEVAPISNQLQECDFVIFDNSPTIRKSCRGQGQ